MAHNTHTHTRIGTERETDRQTDRHREREETVLHLLNESLLTQSSLSAVITGLIHCCENHSNSVGSYSNTARLFACFSFLAWLGILHWAQVLLRSAVCQVRVTGRLWHYHHPWHYHLLEVRLGFH